MEWDSELFDMQKNMALGMHVWPLVTKLPIPHCILHDRTRQMTVLVHLQDAMDVLMRVAWSR